MGREDREIQKILQREIADGLKMDALIDFLGGHEYVVTYRGAHQLQMVKKKVFGFWWAVFWTFFFGLVPFYIFYYLAKRDVVRTFSFEPELKEVEDASEKIARRRRKA